MIVELQTHTPLTQWQPLHIHHAASHVTGRVSLLEDNLAELVFDTPLWLADNDRLVLRDISARNTLAGARVLMLTRRAAVSVSRNICNGWRLLHGRRAMPMRYLFIWNAARLTLRISHGHGSSTAKGCANCCNSTAIFRLVTAC